LECDPCDYYRAFGIRYGTKGDLAERFWRVSLFVFAGVSFWWAVMMLTTGTFGAVK
jgi:hypothetical protein